VQPWPWTPPHPLFGHYDLALDHYHQSIKINKKRGDDKGVAASLGQIGRIYEERGDYDAALEQYEKAKEAFERIGDTKNTAVALHQIGRIYEERGNYEAALEHYRRSLEIKEKIGNIAGMAQSFGQMGMLAFEGEDFGTALRYFVRAFSIFKQIGSPTAKLVGNNIRLVREKMGEEAFLGVLEEMGVSADVLAGEAEAEDEGEERFWQFLAGVTGAAVAARQGKGEDREEILAALGEVLKKLPEGQSEAEGGAGLLPHASDPCPGPGHPTLSRPGPPRITPALRPHPKTKMTETKEQNHRKG
jgi:tetratricopeptide (TPR) repeat protein